MGQNEDLSFHEYYIDTIRNCFIVQNNGNEMIF